VPHLQAFLQASCESSHYRYGSVLSNRLVTAVISHSCKTDAAALSVYQHTRKFMPFYTHPYCAALRHHCAEKINSDLLLTP
jgi:hypothetical protein